jgi:cell division inhibitor SepF
MGFMQRVKVMLGLADEYDDEYDDEYPPEDELEDEDEAYEPAPRYTSPYGAESLSVRRVSREPDVARAREAAPLRAVPSHSSSASSSSGSGAQVKIHAVEPRSYGEAQSIADKFKAGQPVIMNLTGTETELSKRLLDFASGLTYGLDGGIQKVSDKVFMLSPRNVDVSAAGDHASRSSRASSLFGD